MTIKPKAVGIAAVLAIAFVLAFAFALWGFPFHSRHSAEAGARLPVSRPQTSSKPTSSKETSGKTNDDLRQIMEAKVHKDYTVMSFTIWHDRPLTKEKMDAIAEASSHIVQAAQGLQTYEATYRQQGWSAQDMKFFDDKRLQLSHVAEELNRAARSHDESQVVSFFMHMDNTCQSCHKRFRPDLSWI